MIVDVVLNGTYVVDQLFGERERFPNEPTAALTKCIVETFDMIGLATLLTNCPMAFGEEDYCRGFPKVRVTDRALAVNCRQGAPQLPCHRFGACPNRHAHNLASIAVDRKPNPLLAPFLADERS
jgi:hypothetical protein